MKVQELFDLSDQVALVTGGGRGLGEAMTEAFLEAGARVVIASRKLETVEAAASRFQEKGYEVLPLKLDVTNPEEAARVVDTAVERFGRLDVLVNNSGTSWGAPAESMTLDAWHKVMEVNVTGTFLMSQKAVAVMKRQGGGRIINIASVAGLSGIDPRALDAVGYTASKGAVISLTRDLAHKWAPYHVRVNAIAPGWFPTKMSRPVLEQTGSLLAQAIPLGRFGSMDDIKGIALLLATRASDYMTGTVLVVDGGALA